MIEYLPHEVALCILSRLPVTSLLQCKLVCRAWYNLTQNPDLVTEHFSRSGENDPCLILHCNYPIGNQLYSLELSTGNEENQRVNKIRVPMFPEFVVGSSKGLLCLCDSLKLYIYNPFTWGHVKLPLPMRLSNQDAVFGFGFHPETKEYKVVMIWRYQIPRGCHFSGEIIPPKSEVRIFTLGRLSWRHVGNIPYSLQRPGQVLVNGRLHWRTRPQKRLSPRLLISFDLADEQFRVVPKPGDLDRYKLSLVVLGGFLSAAVHRENWQCDIWVMKEYDVKESWTKQFSIGIHVPRGLEQDVAQSFRAPKFYRNRLPLQVLCLLKNGDLLLVYNCRALVSYNPRNDTFKDLSFHGIPDLFEPFVHEGNLTLINM